MNGAVPGAFRERASISLFDVGKEARIFTCSSDESGTRVPKSELDFVREVGERAKMGASKIGQSGKDDTRSWARSFREVGKWRQEEETKKAGRIEPAFIG